MESKLKKLRTDKKVSQKEVASEIGITRPFYTMLENGKRTPSINTAFKLARYFECKIEDII